jgi:hypothetical protein
LSAGPARVVIIAKAGIAKLIRSKLVYVMRGTAEGFNASYAASQQHC